jgi:hypothetical protein
LVPVDAVSTAFPVNGIRDDRIEMANGIRGDRIEVRLRGLISEPAKAGLVPVDAVSTAFAD